MADPDVCEAIQKQDVKQYLSIMKEKGLINDITINDISDLKSSTSINDLIDNTDGDALTGLFIPAVVVGVGLAIWAVAIEYIFAVNAAAAGTVFTVLAAVNTMYTGSNDEIQESRIYESLLSYSAIEVYSIKSLECSSDDIHVLADAYIEQSVDSTMAYLKDIYPDKFKKYSETALKNAILINIQNSIHE